MADAHDDNKLRDIRRLAKRFRITIHSPPNPEQWPANHRRTFQSIQRIGDQKFDTFSASIDIRSSDEPWREQTKHRAEWLAKRAGQLFNQQRNEAGWRFSLENDVLRKFGVEVACPKCRARIWRSEIEASINGLDAAADNLEERRTHRGPCTCAPNDRPQDFYEVGINPLFDDRTQEVIIHDQLLRSQLPKQEPDRVYGLQETRNFEKLLSTPVIGENADTSLRDVVRSSPFKNGVEPLLFPFLILEAKSGKSPSGFYEIQTQTSFPIFALLKLQEDLLARGRNVGTAEKPLVWFLANRGDAWRVYGCCLSESEPARYDILHLWDGSVMSKDSSLQLLLIVDYIFDWARDIYRPSILRQLKSLVTGSTFDQMSLTADSDIVSMRRRDVSDWIQAGPSTVAGLDFEQDFAGLGSTNALAMDHQSLLPLLIPNTQLGTLRSAALVESRIEGLYITDQNVSSLLQEAGGEEPSRQMLKFVSKWDELLLLTGDDIDEMEEVWTGKSRSTTEPVATSASRTEFYVLIETKTYMSTLWGVTRDLTYLAVTKGAFEIIFAYADFRNQHPGRQLVAQAARPCSRVVLTETVRCLRLGSPRQLFIAAITCTCLSLYALPERKRQDHGPPVQGLAFGHILKPRLGDFIQRFHKLARRKEKTTFTFPGRISDLPIAQRQEWLKKRFPPNGVPAPRDTSFARSSDVNRLISEKDVHEESSCARCVRSSEFEEKPYHLTATASHIYSAYGLELAISLGVTAEGPDRHDLCLFATGDLPDVTDERGLAVIVEDLIQSNKAHHTIRQPVSRKVDATNGDKLWSLPMTYRPFTNKERIDATDWVNELRGLPVSQPAVERHYFRWSQMQLLLHFLGKSIPWEEAILKAEGMDVRNRCNVYAQAERKGERRRKAAGGLVDLVPITRWGPLRESTRGD